MCQGPGRVLRLGILPMPRYHASVHCRGGTEGAGQPTINGCVSTQQFFGNPQGGTPFMECTQSVGIDLPLKVLFWEDAQNQVWLGYNEPSCIVQRHGVA